MDQRKENQPSEYPQEKIIFPESHREKQLLFSAKQGIVILVFFLIAGALVFLRASREGILGTSEEEKQTRIRKDLEEGRIPENAPVLGRVIDIFPDRIIARVRTAGVEERDVAVYIHPDTKFFIHFRDASRNPAEIDRSEIKKEQFVIIETREPLGENSAVNAQSVSIIE